MSEQTKTQVLFYHLEREPLKDVLPGLLEKSLERGWKVVVQAGNKERLEDINHYLWTYRADSFLPHGSAGDGFAELQPVYLTLEDDNPNGANVRFFIDGAMSNDVSAYERAVYLFDGHDADAVAAARLAWKGAADAGHEVTYWQRGARGWEKKS